MNTREFWEEIDELILAFRDEPKTEAEKNLDVSAFGLAVADLVADFESEGHEIALPGEEAEWSCLSCRRCTDAKP